ncbi:hypothetical protein TrCOL_g10103 [Triparma columacea]|uniref:Uncharacterized protein n=1 Tax=Triparma columacea TaxID=722753 RepID=A0A9W7L9X4_9STRA|nr:hypothetical protein TrCOL_g10103 [Triparma columacea]
MALKSSIRDYVPLVVSSLVIIDVISGQKFVTFIMGKVYGDSAPPGLGGEDIEGDKAVNNAKGGQSGVKPLIDVDKLVKTSLNQAEDAKSLRTYVDKRRGVKDDIEETRKKINRQLEDLGS